MQQTKDASSYIPVFFRVDSRRAFSGYVRRMPTPTEPSVDIWAWPETAAMATGGRSFTLNADGLTIVPRARLALLVGERVVFTEAIDWRPYAVIEAGERGVVGPRDPETGRVEIVMELEHRGLYDWFNTVECVPHEADDLVEHLGELVTQHTQAVPEDGSACRRA